jgi:UDP-glucose 4-epimerase
MGDYFKVPADKRDLNYDKYFTEGDDNILDVSEYNSHNTDRLEVTEIVDKLLELDYIQEELLGWNKQP